MEIQIRSMTMADFEPVQALWRATEGIGLSDSDQPQAVAAFLQRNPGMSVVALDSKHQIVGVAMCGHDGRRGALYHVAVNPRCRRCGVGRQMLAHCFKQLAEVGILRCNIHVFGSNLQGQQFWRHDGWRERPDLTLMQKDIAL